MNRVGEVGYELLELEADLELVAGWSGGGCGGELMMADAFWRHLRLAENPALGFRQHEDPEPESSDGLKSRQPPARLDRYRRVMHVMNYAH